MKMIAGKKYKTILINSEPDEWLKEKESRLAK